MIIRVSNSLDPDQDGLSVGPDQGPNSLQKGLKMQQCSCALFKNLFNSINDKCLKWNLPKQIPD